MRDLVKRQVIVITDYRPDGIWCFQLVGTVQRAEALIQTATPSVEEELLEYIPMNKLGGPSYKESYAHNKKVCEQRRRLGLPATKSEKQSERRRMRKLELKERSTC